MPPGPRPKSSAQRRLGPRSHHKVNDSEPQHDPPGHAFDVPPPELTGRAADEWRRLAPLLRQARQVTEVDKSALVAACLEWATYLEASQRVAIAGPVVNIHGAPQPNPYRTIARGALSALTRLWPELGLTPSSRSRVKMAELGPRDDAFSEFDSFDDPKPH
jgi:P27 family predicted phage terminase small subunit